MDEDDAQATFVELHSRLGHRYPKEMEKDVRAFKLASNV